MSGSEIILGFDFGLRRTGVAIGQHLTGTARPLATLDMAHGEPDWEALDRLIREWRPQTLVVGRPTHMNGDSSPITQAAERFRRQLENRYSLTALPVDERLSSKIAESLLQEQRQAGQRKRIKKAEVDAHAAALILQDWLR